VCNYIELKLAAYQDERIVKMLPFKGKSELADFFSHYMLNGERQRENL